MDQHKVDRFLSLLLMIGGAAGVAVTLVVWVQAALASFLAFGFVIVFSLTVWVGIGLWRGRPRYYLWAQIIFALQVPIVTCSAFKYLFFTAMMMEFSYEIAPGNKLNIEWQLGSNLSFAIARETPDFVIGVNLIAVAALAYLLFLPRKSMLGRAEAQLVSPESPSTNK